MRKALHCLSLLLVPALTLDEGHAGPRFRLAMRPSAEPCPYLPALGSSSMRIAEAPPPPDLVTRPAASAPPVPALSPVESSVAVANTDAVRTTVAPSSGTPMAAKSDAKSDTPETTEPAAQVTTPPPAPEVKSPPPILPDSVHPVVHPEDFLPYFQIPGGRAADVNVIVPGVPSAPAPAPLPPSSATYIQSR